LSFQILAISGSLRARSSNTELLRAAAIIAGDIANVRIFEGVVNLPHFNPDLDVEGAVLPDAVVAFRSEVERADALLISSPEYAHGVPGSFKNALDWLVSGPETPGKLVGLLNASVRSLHAHAQLQETLRTMSARVVNSAVVTVPLDGRRLTAAQIAADSELSAVVRSAIQALIESQHD
jgi:NAD(P)H-dependent FMN reductase